MLSLTLALALSQAPKLAAPPWTTVEVSAEKAQFFATHLASALRSRGLSVITAQDISTVLGVERQKQLLGCGEDTSSCLVELGNALGAELILTASIAKLESTWQVNLRVLRAGDGKVAATQLAKATSQEQLLDALDTAAAGLALELGVKPAPRSARSLAWIPAVAAGGFAIAGGIFYGLALGRSADLDKRLEPGVTRADLDPIVRSGQTFELLGWAGGVLALASGATALVMFIAGAPAPAVSFTPVPGGGVVGLGGAL
ncbi:MAG: hypothetical protein JNJ54_02310 [Myxococcaceae bacterium]|nr:hypothetical protein [Myxococcaceae bacterium]